MQESETNTPGFDGSASRHKASLVAGMAGVFLPALLVLVVGRPWVGDSPLRLHLVVVLANLLMLLMVWLDLRLRGQSWADLGLTFSRPDRRTVVRAVLLSLVVFVAALAAVAVGAVVMANIVGRPEGADMSSYNYLRGNLPMLVVALASVYVTASLGEEIIYRGFLMNRIAQLGSGTRGAWTAAVLISSVVFGVIHADWALTGIVMMSCMGLAFAVSYLALGRKLWPLILAHGYLDTILIVQMYFG